MNRQIYSNVCPTEWYSRYVEPAQELCGGSTLKYHRQNDDQTRRCKHSLSRDGYGVSDRKGKTHGSS